MRKKWCICGVTRAFIWLQHVGFWFTSHTGTEITENNQQQRCVLQNTTTIIVEYSQRHRLRYLPIYPPYLPINGRWVPKYVCGRDPDLLLTRQKWQSTTGGAFDALKCLWYGVKPWRSTEDVFMWSPSAAKYFMYHSNISGTVYSTYGCQTAPRRWEGLKESLLIVFNQEKKKKLKKSHF